MMGGMGLGGIGMGIFSEGSKYAAAALQQWRNEKEARKSRRWAWEFDSTKYQRATADMRAAGLNPVLAISGGVRGGGAPGAQMASGAPSPGGTGFAAGRMAALLRAEAEQARNSAKASAHQPDLALWNAASAREQAWMLRSQGNRMDAERRNLEIQNKLLRAQVPSAKVMEMFDQTPEGKRLREIRRYIDSLSPFIPRTQMRLR